MNKNIKMENNSPFLLAFIFRIVYFYTKLFYFNNQKYARKR